MSATIDSRVVEMRFDNKNFESNVQTSLSTLDKLKNSLNMNGAAKSFEQIDNAAKKVNMSGLGNAVESVRLKFSALEVMAVTALSNITTAALNAGMRIAKELTLDPVKLGFSEYETQIGAVQTILANTSHQGTNLQQVNRALDELNIYADKTIYNFTEMTRNIGTFTAAGIDLQTAVDAIKGIANLAAVSGSTSQQASTAMYQLSQALAAGRVTLMDWNSVVNAGMGGKVFQDALIRTSELLGTGAQAAIDTYGSFRESLTKGEWLTTEVLTETLKQFAGAYSEADLIQQGFTAEQARSIMDMAKTAEDAATKVKTFTQLFDTLKESAQSGWTQTWEILIGDFEEAKEVLTEISNVVGDVISKSAEARNEILSGGLSSGWKQLLSVGIADEAGYIDSIQEVARAHGDAFDQMVADSDSFSDALKKGLQEGVISSETLSNAVFNLQEKMSGMSVEELKAAGYTSEMVTQIESLASGLRDGSISMDEFTEKIMRPSGRENLIQALWNAAKGLMSVITPIKEAFTDIFPPITADQLYKITEGFRSLTERLTLSETASTNLKNTFKGLFAVVDIIGKAFISVIKAIGSLLGGIGKLSGGLLSITGSFGEWLVKLNETIETTDIFNKVFGSIANFIKNAAAAIKNFITTVAKNFKIPGFELFHNLLGRVQDRMSQVGEAAGSMKSGVVAVFKSMGEALANCQFAQILKTIWNTVKTITSGIVNSFGSISEAIISSLGEANFSGIIDLLNGASLGAIAVGITKLIGSFRGAIDKIGNIKESVIGILDSVRGCFEAYQSQLKADLLLKIASAIAILTSSIVVLSLIDSHKLSAALGAITVLFADLMASMAVFNKIGGKESRVMKSVTAMLGISTAVLILASALKKLGDLDVGQLITGLVGIAGLTAMVIAAAKAMSSGGPTIIKGATRMVIFAAAIKVLASACEDLSKLSWGELAKGLVGVGVLLASVSMFTNNTKFMVNSITTATGIVILASAIKVLASACKDFGSMSWNEVIKGLVSVGVLLTSISKFTNKTKFVVNSITTATGIVILASAIKVLASAVGDFGSMSWEEIAKGLIALGGSIVILSVGLKAMNGTLLGSAAMLVAASALLIMTTALSVFGAMSWESIAKGLVALAGAFAVIGVAGLVLAPLVPTILSLCVALALIGVSMLGIGAGLTLVSAGLSALAVALTALATAGTAGATAIVASLTIIFTGIAELIPTIMTKIGDGIAALWIAIANNASAIGEAFRSVILMLVVIFGECVPAIADVMLSLVDGILKALVKYTPSIVDSIMGFLIGILEGIARNLPSLIQAAVDVLMSLFSGVVDALSGVDMETLLQGITGVGLLTAIMAALAVVSALIPGAMLGVLGMGAVIAELALVLAAVGMMAQIPGLEWFIDEGGDLLQHVGTAIGKFIGGIAGGFASGVASQLPQIATDLSGFMANIQPFVQGASAIDSSMMDGVNALADTIVALTAANILDGLTSWMTGGSSLTSFAEELVPFGKAMKQFSEEVAGIDGGVITNASTAGKALAEMAATLPNSGGVAAWFAGENDMSAFAEQLVPFGKAMKGFADEVAGMDTAVVGEASTAGKALAEMAATLPNSGGVAAWFAGENDMLDFCVRLVPFGRAMKGFAEAVSGLRTDVVQNGATAGKALVELANTIPNTGGVVSWFTGDNDLILFSEQLVPFGQAMKNYSLSVAGLDSDVVTNSTNAAKALMELANNLPNNGGIVSWFTGDNDIASFGEQLVEFGKSFANYYNSISGIDVNKLNGVVAEFRNLVDLANVIKNVDTSGMSNFAKDLTNLGNSGVDGFINAFVDANSKITTAFTTMVNSIVRAFESQYYHFTVIGNTMMTNLASGVRSKEPSLKNAFITIIAGCLTAIRNKYREFYNAGEYLVEGFAKGIEENTWQAEESAAAMASAAADAAKAALDINSPSKVGRRIGGFFGMGFVNSLIDYADKSYEAGVEMASAAKNGLSNAISKVRDFVEGNVDAQPTIRPVLDLSEVRSGAHMLSALLSRKQAMTISTEMNRQSAGTIQNGKTAAPVTGNSYSLVQNNYSPKALSRIDIYRQTKNQFSALKGLVET